MAMISKRQRGRADEIAAAISRAVNAAERITARGIEMKNRRRKAFTAICTNGGYIIGLADEGIDGYTPCHEVYGVYESYEAARNKADELNATLGLSEREAALIVCTTMRGSIRTSAG